MANCTPIIQVIEDGNGNPQNIPVPPPLLSPIAVNTNAAGALALVGATAGMIVRVYRVLLYAAAATTLTFDDGSTGLPGAIAFNGADKVLLDLELLPWFQTAVGDALNLNNGSAVQITGAVWVNLNAN
jgi:hypothetical protein